MQTEKENISALDLLNPKSAQPKEQKIEKETNSVKQTRKRRSIFIFSEKPMKRVSLKFLNRRFKATVPANAVIKKDEFLEILYHHIDTVRISQNKIGFGKRVDKTTIDIVSLNYPNLKTKYKRACEKLLKNTPVEFDGSITDKKVVMDLMLICQSAYARSYGSDKKYLVPMVVNRKSEKVSSVVKGKKVSAAEQAAQQH